MVEPVCTELILVNNGDSPQAGEVFISLPTRWTPRPGHYLDMIIRRVDFVNFFQYNINATNNTLDFSIAYPIRNATGEFPWVMHVHLVFLPSRVTEVQFAEMFNTALANIYKYVFYPGQSDLFPGWKTEGWHDIPGSHEQTRVRLELGDALGYVQEFVPNTGGYLLPYLAYDEVRGTYYFDCAKGTANAGVLMAGPHDCPAIYPDAFVFSLANSPLALEIGLLDTNQGDNDHLFVLEYPALKHTAVQWAAVSGGSAFDYSADIYTTMTEPIYDTANLPAFPNVVWIGPKMLMIESLTVAAPRYGMVGFHKDVPKRFPIYTVPFPPSALSGYIQLYTSDPVPSFRIPGELESLHFRFLTDGELLREDGFEITLEIMIREMPDHESLADPSFRAQSHGVVGPPIVDFKGVRPTGHRSMPPPDAYDDRLKRPRKIH